MSKKKPAKTGEKIRRHLALPTDLWRLVRSAAAAEGLRTSEFVEKVLRERLEK